MLIATVVMIVVALSLLVVAYAHGVHAEGIRSALRTFLPILPLLLAVFTIAGMVEVLIPKEKVAALLGDQAGLRGIALGCLAGAVTPGGPYVSFPVVATIYHAGAGVGTIVAYVTAWSLWAVARLPMEIAIIGPRLTLIRVLSTLIFPPIAGLIARAFLSGLAR
ncbi:MAG: permease [Armatimonadota bacterium]|nr:MAG: permease [Armatimonadota bacterium]